MDAPEQLSLIQRSILTRPLSDGVRVFASGMNRVADIRAAAAARVPIGVDVSKISPKGVKEIIESELPVLLDSGAFSEVAIRHGQVCVVREISDGEWRRRLSIYLQIAKAVGGTKHQKDPWPKVSIIAPDRVGSQEITLVRLKKFHAEVNEVHAMGADVLIPLQCGMWDAVNFYDAATEALDIDIVPAFPMNKAPTTVTAILEFLSRTSVSRIHLLGMGANNRALRGLIRLVGDSHPTVRISTDANKIRAIVGARRPVTLKEPAYCDDLMSQWSGEIDLRQWGGDVHDMTEMLFEPSSWLKHSELTRVAQSLTWLTEAGRNAFVEDPDSFVNADENQNDWLHQALMRAYASHVKKHCRVSARTRAVFESLSRSKIGYQV